MLKDFGFNSLGISEEDLLNPENVIQLGYPPARIDLLTDLTDLDFENCFEKREEVSFEGVPINFIDIDSLITAKLSANRPQDIVDVGKLREGKKK